MEKSRTQLYAELATAILSLRDWRRQHQSWSKLLDWNDRIPDTMKIPLPVKVLIQSELDKRRLSNRERLAILGSP